jgi:hypothetical protein
MKANMTNPRIMLLTLLSVLILPAASLAQEIYAIGGGTRTDVDPKNKKRILLIAENNELRLTVGVPKQNKPVLGLFEIWAKVENLSDKPLTIDPTKYHAIDAEGRAYSGVAPNDAIQRMLDRTATMRTAMGNIIMGPLAGPSNTQATERQARERVNREALATGDIPPHSFKEGVIWFEAPKQKKFALQITLTELWLSAFTFSTEKPKS